ncbi:MAG TPA: hypothetical protein VN937_06050 [Blastocatellia bacterium]|nr:hypothetical protein [Blastocatellia bacterium]
MLRQAGNIQGGESEPREPVGSEGWKPREESPTDQPGTAEKLEQLETVLRSQTLASSPNLRVLLQYLVVKAIGDQEIHLKEYTIATEVFGRAGTFDSRTDSVVRVQAKRLRTKLQEYYEQEGKSDKIFIDVPKGHYSVVFSYIRNGPKVEDALDIDAETMEAPVEAPAALSRKVDRDRASKLVLILTIIVLAIVIAVLALSVRDLQRQPRESGLVNEEAEAGAVWRPFFSSATPALLVLSNPAVYRFSNAADPDVLLKKSVELTPEQAGWLAEALKDRFVMRQNRIPKLILAPADYTGVGEAIGLQLVADLFRSAGKSITLKQSRTVSAEDMKTYNVISLGSVWANDWSGKLPIKEDFTYSVNATIINASPEPGEEKEYRPRFNERTGDLVEDYGLITVKPGVTDETTLMILAGVKSEGTQAAAEYVTKKEYLSTLNQHLQQLSAKSGPPKYYQVLLKVDVDNGIPITASILTIHRLEVTRNPTDH